jgi:DNA-binding transcriptional ArsR family regulator
LIRVHLPAHPEEHVVFAYSPLLECVLSLHVLVGPGHHALQHAWVRQMRAHPPGLRRRIDAFAFLYRWTLPDLLVPAPNGSVDSFHDELARLKSLDAALLLEEFGRPLYDHGGRHGEGVYQQADVQAAMLERASAQGEQSLALARLLLDDPTEFVRRFCNLLADYWRAAFESEWLRIEPRLAESVAQAGQQLARSGVWAVLGRLPARCRIDPDRGALLVDLPHEHDITIDDTNPLLLSPSVYVWPHLRVNCDRPWPTTIIYTAPFLAQQTAPRIPPRELLQLLRAVADDTRLRILKLIAEQPRSTQELAPLVGLSTAGLSKNLRRLAEADLVTTHREGYYVIYTLNPTRTAALAEAISKFLRDDTADADRRLAQ